MEWWRSTEVTVFLDGLDRIPLPRRSLDAWLSKTADEIRDGGIRLLITTRPELASAAALALGIAGQKPPGAILSIGAFSEWEAALAAKQLGRPHLARHRHPALMYYRAQVETADDGAGVPREQVVAAFLDHRLQRVAAFVAEVPFESISSYVDGVGRLLWHSADGTLSRDDLRSLEQQDPQIYRALRAENLIVASGHTGRFDPDDLAEHLAGRHVDLDTATAQVDAHLQVPLKLGALRSALEQRCARDPAQTQPYVERLLGSLDQHGSPAIIPVASSIIQAHADLSPLLPIALMLGRHSKQMNMFAHWGDGLQLLELFCDRRWTTGQRLQLLWSLAKRESAYDWRPKHWLTPHEAPNFQETPWRSRFIMALLEAGREGLEFLLAHFQSQEALPETTESNLGDLARGCFFLVSPFQLETAFVVLSAGGVEQARDLRRQLAHAWPRRVLPILQAEPPFLQVEDLIDLLGHILEENRPLQVAVEQAGRWLAVPKFGRDRRLLRILASAGQAHAANELLTRADLNAEDVYSFFGLEGSELRPLVSAVLKMAQEQQKQNLLEGLAWGTPTADQARALCAPLQECFTHGWAPRQLALLLESMLRACIDDSLPYPEVFELATVALRAGNKDCTRMIIYACCGSTPDEALPEAGRELRRKIVALLVRTDTDAELLQLFASKLMQAQADSSFYREQVLQLALCCTSFDVFADFPEWDEALFRLAGALRSEVALRRQHGARIQKVAEK